MLAWLILLITALGGLLFALETGIRPETAPPGFAIALAVVGALALLYVMTFATRSSDDDNQRPWLLWVLAIGAALVSSGPLIKDLGLLNQRTSRDAASQGTNVRDAVAAAGPAAVLIRRSADGRFSTRATLNGQAADVVIDTGASAIMLRSTDAQAAGIDVATLRFDTPIATANGTTYAAPIRIRSVSVGVVELRDIEAFVAKPGSLNETLLGMSFLRGLTSYEMAGEFLTLRN